MEKNKIKLCSAFAAVLLAAVLFAALFVPIRTITVHAGLDRTVVSDANSITNEIDLAVFRVDAASTSLYAENGKARFAAATKDYPVTKMTFRTRVDNNREYGVEQLFDYSAVFAINDVAADAVFALTFGMPRVNMDYSAEDSESLFFSVKEVEGAKRLAFSVAERTTSGDRTLVEERAFVYPQPQLCEEFTLKLKVKTDNTADILLKSGAEEVKFKGIDFSVGGNGFVGMFAKGNVNAYVRDVNFIVYSEYSAPENVDFTETFEHGGVDCYNKNLIHTEAKASAMPDSSLSVRDGALVFNNAGNGFVATKYMYSNFELNFDITQLQRRAEYNADGSLKNVISGFFGVSFGVRETGYVDHVWNTRFLLFQSFPFEEDYDRTKPYTGKTKYQLGEYLSTTRISVNPDKAKGEIDLWDEEIDRRENKTVNIRISLIDGVFKLFMKYEGEEWKKPVLEYDYGFTPLGYIRIWTYGGTALPAKGAAYARAGTFAIDNLCVKNMDAESAKNTLPDPGFASNIREQTPDYNYVTKPDPNDLTFGESAAASGGCGAAAGTAGTVVALAAISAAAVAVRRKK